MKDQILLILGALFFINLVRVALGSTADKIRQDVLPMHDPEKVAEGTRFLEIGKLLFFAVLVALVLGLSQLSGVANWWWMLPGLLLSPVCGIFLHRGNALVQRYAAATPAVSSPEVTEILEQLAVFDRKSWWRSGQRQEMMEIFDKLILSYTAAPEELRQEIRHFFTGRSLQEDILDEANGRLRRASADSPGFPEEAFTICFLTLAICFERVDFRSANGTINLMRQGLEKAGLDLRSRPVYDNAIYPKLEEHLSGWA